MITVHGLCKSYGSRQVLSDLSFEVSPGGVTLLVGANGSGKSTTMRVLAGLAETSAGRVAMAGTASYLPQSPRFHPRLTVTQTLQFYAFLRALPSSRIDDVMHRWGLEPWRDASSAALSGGVRQRLALAVFSLPEAEVLLLDEPGLSLDPDWRRTLQDALHASAADGRTVLIATHLLGEWEGQADRCLLLERGRITRELAPHRLRDAFPFSAGRTPQVAVS